MTTTTRRRLRRRRRSGLVAGAAIGGLTVAGWKRRKPSPSGVWRMRARKFVRSKYGGKLARGILRSRVGSRLILRLI